MNMILTEIEIINLLSFKNAKFVDLENFNVLIGKNNAGKSNLFRIFFLLYNSYKNKNIENRFYYDANTTLSPEINLTFNLSSEFREKIFEILINNHLLSKSFELEAKINPIFQDNGWRDKSFIINYLISRDYFKRLKIYIKVQDINYYLYIEKIQVINENNTPQDHFYYNKLDNNLYEYKLFDYQAFLNRERPLFEVFFNSYFRQITIESLRSISGLIKNYSFSAYNPPLGLIFNELIKFFENIHIIPPKRIFFSQTKTNGKPGLELDKDGKNLVTIIYNKLVTNHTDWLSSLNNHLIGFIDDVKNLRQTTDYNDTKLILNENNLNLDIEFENMGAGILNIAFFIAYIMEYGKNITLCIEEPEIHLYPHLQIQLRDKFLDVSKNNQIFITTHSREFLSEDQNECSVYLVKKENNQSSANKIFEENFQEIYEELDLDMEKYRLQQSFLYTDHILEKFVKKTMEPKRNEEDLWDFKQSFDFWELTNNNQKKKAKIKFCNQVTSYANHEGGILIVGITNNDPKEIIGIDDYENKVKQIKLILKQFTTCSFNFIKCRELILKNSAEIDKNCMIIAIKQTKTPISVQQEDGNYIYKIRNNSETSTITYKELVELKKEVKRDNFNFFNDLKKFIKKESI